MTLWAHLQSGTTTIARCWRLRRRDGGEMGFTDHDRDLVWGDVVFSAASGLNGEAISQTSGLAVDNSEVAGLLRAEGLTAEDLRAGLYDGAQIEVWEVNWANPSERALVFRASLGEVVWGGAAFRVELRGQAEVLNQPQGRVYQASCSADLGDRRCGIDLEAPGLRVTGRIERIEGERVFWLSGLDVLAPRWFEGGRMVVRPSLAGRVKSDRVQGELRRIEIWEAVRVPLEVGADVQLEAGCDRQGATCRAKFDNFLNFRGFPHVPSEDWLFATPQAGA